MSVYIYNLGFEGLCQIGSTDQTYISLSVQASPTALRIVPFNLTIQNSSNQVVKRFQYNKYGTNEFVLAANALYDWRTPYFSLPPGTYKVTAGYSAYSDIPAGKYYACGDTSQCTPFIEVPV